jgi:hypothetical protein
MNLSNLPKSTKRLLAVLGVAVIVAAYMILSGGGNDSSTAPPPAATTPAPAASSGQGQEGSAATGSPDSSLPVDPTDAQRPGSQPQDLLPARLPGTTQIVLVYNPFQMPG